MSGNICDVWSPFRKQKDLDREVNESPVLMVHLLHLPVSNVDRV